MITQSSLSLLISSPLSRLGLSIRPLNLFQKCTKWEKRSLIRQSTLKLVVVPWNSMVPYCITARRGDLNVSCVHHITSTVTSNMHTNPRKALSVEGYLGPWATAMHGISNTMGRFLSFQGVEGIDEPGHQSQQMLGRLKLSDTSIVYSWAMGPKE